MKRAWVGGLLVGFLYAASAFANTTAFVAGTGLVTESGPSVNIGTSFTVGGNGIDVTALGFYDMGSANTVALYASGGSLLAQVVVPTGTDVGGYAFASITPVLLTAGSTYLVDEFSANGNSEYGNGVAPTAASGITIGSDFYQYSSSLQFPTNGGPNGYYGANFQFTTVTPEPSTFSVVFTVGIAGVLFSVWRRRRNRVSSPVQATAGA